MQEIINAVVIDDKEADIFAVTKALSKVAISTIPIHFEGSTGATQAFRDCAIAAEALPRVIITDIQMTTSGGVSATPTDIRNTTNCLLKIVSNTRGPYIILAWSSVLDSFNALEKSVNDVFEAKGIRRPVYFGKICKIECGSSDGFDIKKILHDFLATFDNQKQIKALMHWEKSALNSAIETVNSIIEDTEDDLEKVLGSLGVTVAGKNLQGFEATAINEAFSYIMKDKLAQSSLNNNSQKIWQEALTDKNPILIESSKHTLNSLLHVDSSPNDKIVCPGDIWALDPPQPVFNLMARPSEYKEQLERFKSEIITFSPDKTKLDKRILKSKNTNYKRKLQRRLKKEYTTPRQELLDNMKPILLEISPACDFSNKKKPLKTLVAGVLVPSKYFNDKLLIKSADSIISCPIKFEDEDQYLIFTAKYLLSLSDKMINHADLKMKKLFRIRESLLQSWIHKINSFNSRIGTVSFH